jgi:hypothetical protein
MDHEIGSNVVLAPKMLLCFVHTNKSSVYFGNSKALYKIE